MKEETYQIIKAACEAHIAAGGQIISQEFWGARPNCKCPMACVYDNLEILGPVDASVAQSLGIGKEDFWNFVAGFDHHQTAENWMPFYAAGARLRAEMKL